MITIRNEQDAAFRKSMFDRFVDRMLTLFMNEYPDDYKAIPRSHLRPIFEGQIRKAQQFGLQTEKGVFTYLWAAKVLQPNFAEFYPEAREILESPRLPENAKSQRIHKWGIQLLEKQNKD